MANCLSSGLISLHRRRYRGSAALSSIGGLGKQRDRTGFDTEGDASYSDFLVHEIDKLNNVVRLQTLAVAAERKEGPGDEVLESGLHQQV